MPAAAVTSFPALLGAPVADAVAAIRASNAALHVVALEEGGMMTMDWREDRVRVIHNAAGLVTQVPRVG